MSDYDRFEFLEMDGQPARQVCEKTPHVPRASLHTSIVQKSRKLVVDQVIGGHGSAIGEFNCPCGLAVDRLGNLYVADAYNHRIQKITPNGDVTVIGGRGSEPGRFLNPQDVFVDEQLTMHVLEQGNCRIQRITTDGRLDAIIGRRGGRIGEFNSPMGFAVDNYGSIYVADTGNSRMQKLADSGSPIYVLSSTNDKQLYGPQGVEIDGLGNFYVADTFSHCIVKFDPNGREITRFGRCGCGPTEFDEPQDLALDRHGILYIVEMRNNRLHAIGSDSTFLGVLELSGTAVGKMNQPSGVAVSPNGEIFISDTMNHRVLRVIWR